MKWLKVKQPEYRVKERGFYDPERVWPAHAEEIVAHIPAALV